MPRDSILLYSLCLCRDEESCINNGFLFISFENVPFAFTGHLSTSLFKCGRRTGGISISGELITNRDAQAPSPIYKIKIWILARFPGDSPLVWEVLHWEFSWVEFISTHDPEKKHLVSFLKHEGRILSFLYQKRSCPLRLLSVCHMQWSYALDILPTWALKP